MLFGFVSSLVSINYFQLQGFIQVVCRIMGERLLEVFPIWC